MVNSQCICFHPPFRFNQLGDCVGAELGPGIIPSVDGCHQFIEPNVQRCLRDSEGALSRADAALANPQMYLYLERRNIGYGTRLRSYPVLQQGITHPLTRPTR